MPQKFKQLPITVEAIQFQGNYNSAGEIIEWINKETNFDPLRDAEPPALYYYGDFTINDFSRGKMNAVKGDWIVKTGPREFQIVKPKTFNSSYRLETDLHTLDADDWTNYMDSMRD